MSDSSGSFSLELQEENESGVVKEFVGNDFLEKEEVENIEPEKSVPNHEESLPESSILAPEEPHVMIERPVRELSAEDLNTTEHPLETIEKYERNISSKLAGVQDLETKFILSNFKATAEAKFASIEYNILDTITKHCFPDEHNEIPLHNGENWGVPRCLTILAGHYIAIGTSNPIVVLFNYTLTSLQKFGTDKEKEYGAVTAIDISPKDEILFSGHENGNIVLWSIEKNSRLKKIKAPEKCPIMSLKVLKETKSQFIATTTKGSIYLYKVEQVLLKLSSDKKLIYPTDAGKKKPQANQGHAYSQNLSEGFCGTHVLSKELTRNHPLNKYTLVAFNSANQVLVIAIEPAIRVLYSSGRPNGVSHSILPCISWGKGAIPAYEDNKHPLLALSWGKHLYLIQFENVDNPENGGIKNVGYYLSNHDISHIEWFSENNLLVHNTEGELKVLYSGYFKQNPSPDYTKAVMDSQIIDNEIRFQRYNEGRVGGQIEPARYYTNTIKGISSARRVFIMGEKNMFVGKHYDWSEYIKDLTSKAEWLLALALCVEFFRGNIKKYAGVPNNLVERREVLEPVSKDLIKSYISSISKISDVEPDWVTAILTTIDFLVSIENTEYLFDDMSKMFEQLGKKDMFLQCLEPFILKNRITYVPNDAFKAIVKYYISQKKPEVIQYLIINLSIENLDFDFAITMCMENNLLTALLYLCSHKNGEGVDGPDFFTPIAKAINSYQRSLEGSQPNTKELAIRFLWFLHMTINGRMFPYGVIPDQIWEKQVQDIVVMLFEEQNIDLMLKADPYVSFEIFKLLFQPTVSRVIEASSEGSIHIAGSSRKGSMINDLPEPTLSLPEIQLMFVRNVANKIQGQMLGFIYYCAKKKREYENQLYFLFADLIVNMGYKLPNLVVEECIEYLLQNWREIPPWEYNKKRQEDRDEELDNELSNEERSVLLLGLLNKVREEISDSKERLQEFASVADKTELVDVRAYLLEMGNHYKKAFELYLHQRKESYKLKVFIWLDRVIPYLKQTSPTRFNQLKDEIIARLSDLVTINSEKARKVVLGLDRSLEIEVIEHLKPVPYLQLNYLKRILAKRDEGSEVPDKFLVLHIELLCKLFPKQVYPEVQAYNYPLDECLKICKQYNVKDAHAFFSEKAGNSLEALDAWIEFFLESVKKKRAKVDRKGVFGTGHLTQKFDCLRGVCIRHSKLGDYESEKLWFRLLDKLLQYYDEQIARNLGTNDLFRDYHTNVCYARFVKVVSEYIATLFDDLTKNVLVESLMTKLQEYKSLKLGELRTSLVGMLQTYHHENNLLTDATTLLKGDIYDNVSHIYADAAEGFRTDSLVINDGNTNTMVMFECGHLFPRDCVEAKVCLICADADIIKSEHIINNFRRGFSSLRPNRNPASASANPDAIELLASDRGRLIAAFNRGGVVQQIGEINSKTRQVSNMSRFDEKKIEKANDWDDFMKKAL